MVRMIMEVSLDGNCTNDFFLVITLKRQVINKLKFRAALRGSTKQLWRPL